MEQGSIYHIVVHVDVVDVTDVFLKNQLVNNYGLFGAFKFAHREKVAPAVGSLISYQHRRVA